VHSNVPSAGSIWLPQRGQCLHSASLVMFGRIRLVHEQPEPTDGEQEEAPERRSEEDAMRYPGHEDPHSVQDPDPSSADS
jgi:hypothetical protein